MYPRNRQQLIIFARAPVIGRVKTRIARDAGDQRALAIYRQLLSHTLEQFRHADHFRVCGYTDAPGHAFFDRDKSRGMHFKQQQGDDLGERMYHALENELRHHSSVILIGSDCPAIDAAQVSRAFEKLAAGNEAVIVPADDGGYVLIGFSEQAFRRCDADGRVIRQVFGNIDWGSEQVFRQTCQRFEQLGLAFQALPALADIDTLADYQSWKRQSGKTPSAGPHQA